MKWWVSGVHNSKINSKKARTSSNNINNNFYRHLLIVLMSFVVLSKTRMVKKKRLWTLKQVKMIKFRNYYSWICFQGRCHPRSRFTSNHGKFHLFGNCKKSHWNQLKKAGNNCRRCSRLSILVGLACSVGENVWAQTWKITFSCCNFKDDG